MAELYWIRTSEMTDMFTEGYIGITVGKASVRFSQHKVAAKNPEKQHLHIYKAFKKYGVENLILQVLVVGSNEYVSSLEEKLRPRTNVGWNLAQGGQATGVGRIQSEETRRKKAEKLKNRKFSQETLKKMSANRLGMKFSKEHCESMRQCRLGKKDSEETRQKKRLAMSNRPELVPLPWNASRANGEVWKLAETFQKFTIENPKAGSVKVALVFGLKTTSTSSIIKKLKSGWNPTTDVAYQEWLQKYNEQKELNEAAPTN